MKALLLTAAGLAAAACAQAQAPAPRYLPGCLHKAVSAYEMKACLESESQRMDALLQKRFKAAMAKCPPEERDALAAEQRAWELGRERARMGAGSEAEVLQKSSDALNATARRVEELERRF
ncbi:MAG: DUF1311 domain-containing protein [Duodenibacillus sp.]|nr:DUF1311 domain-containing protein [Duodenibacillus sp.]